MIPKRLAQIWIGNKYPEPRRLMATWRDKHPDWEYVVYRNEGSPDGERPWRLQHIINRMPELNGKADVMRLEILLEHGGVVVDADSECLRPLDDLPDAECWAAYEREGSDRIAAGYLGAMRCSHFIGDVISCVEEMARLPGWSRLPAWQTVGPGPISHVARTGKHPELLVHPAALFMTGGPGAYARQYWASTFESPHFQYRGL
jgi:mannosyltransferase OCH1-like enzyme